MGEDSAFREKDHWTCATTLTWRPARPISSIPTPGSSLADIFSRFGEEPRARSIAQAVVEHRPLNTTLELADLVTKTLGGRKKRYSPCYQGLPGPADFRQR